MDIDQVMHVLRAASGVTNQKVFVVIGSQAALLQFPDMSDGMRNSPELVIYPKNDASLANLIEGSIGRDSIFHATFGYYADGVGPETARLPSDWEGRAKSFEINAYEQSILVIAPEIHDLAISKLLAGREKDIEWIAEGRAGGLIDADRLRTLLPCTNASPEEISLAEARISALEAKVEPK